MTIRHHPLDRDMPTRLHHLLSRMPLFRPVQGRQVSNRPTLRSGTGVHSIAPLLRRLFRQTIHQFFHRLCRYAGHLSHPRPGLILLSMI